MRELVALLDSFQFTACPKYWQAFDLARRLFREGVIDHKYGELYAPISGWQD